LDGFLEEQAAGHMGLQNGWGTDGPKLVVGMAAGNGMHAPLLAVYGRRLGLVLVMDARMGGGSHVLGSLAFRSLGPGSEVDAAGLWAIQFRINGQPSLSMVYNSGG
jgi:hypothetical protein